MPLLCFLICLITRIVPDNLARRLLWIGDDARLNGVHVQGDPGRASRGSPGGSSAGWTFSAACPRSSSTPRAGYGPILLTGSCICRPNSSARRGSGCCVWI